MTGERPCVLWSKAIKSNGYGVRWWRGKLWHAHRAAYVEEYGEIPDGLHVDHLCGNRACVEPTHLQAITQAEHNRRHASLKTTCPKGHPLDGVSAGDRRYCKTCARESMRRQRARRREASA